MKEISSLHLGECLLELNQANEGDEQLQTSFAWAPADRSALLLAKCLVQIDVRLAPESTSAWHSLSVVCSMLGKSKEAANAQEVSHQTQQRCQRLFNAVTELAAKPE